MLGGVRQPTPASSRENEKPSANCACAILLIGLFVGGLPLVARPTTTVTACAARVNKSFIALMSVKGLLDVITDGDFYQFVQQHLLPLLMPFNGTNHLTGWP